MIRLITSYYTDSDLDRQKELDFCLKKNIDNDLIDEILILNENDTLPLESKKIRQVKFSRPKFKDFFNIINSITKKEDINILTNTDIFFNTSLSQINKLDLTNKVITLLRWEYNGGNPTIPIKRGDCQDSWIWLGDVKPLDNSDFYLGKLGCDNRIAWEFKNVGYTLTNNCDLIHSIHVHETRKRNYTQTFVGTKEHEENKEVIPPPYFYVYPN
jgi:hypothetical protein